MGSSGWKSGDQILVRSMWGEKIQAAWPMTVVVDSEEVLVLYLAGGTAFKIRSTYPAIHLPVGEWEAVDDVWRNDLVRIMYTGDDHAYLASWNGDRFRNWYVNLDLFVKTPRQPGARWG